MKAPRIAVSVGDTAGIGPEVALDAVRDGKVRDSCSPVLFWPRSLPVPPGMDVRLCGGRRDGPAKAGIGSLEAALRAVVSGECAALCTAPVNKDRTARILPGFRGHTEWLAARAGVDPADVLMIFHGRKARVACATRHVALRQVPDLLAPRSIAWSAMLLWGYLRWDLGIANPRLAVCGLNPHASESGMLGDEEERVIHPGLEAAVQALASIGVLASIDGPVPADAAMRAHVTGGSDGVLAMFHDQATIAAKVADPLRSVNVTAGLPFVRTSPDHGTADSLAGTGEADCGSMVAAMLLAARLSRRSNGLEWRLGILREALHRQF